MGANFHNPVLQKISEVYEAATKCRLEQEIFYKLDSKLAFLAEKLEMTKEQAFFFSILLTLSFDHEGVSYRDLSTFFGCNSLAVINFNSAFEELKKRELIESRRRTHFRGKRIEELHVSDHIKDAVLKNIFPLRIQKTPPENITDLLETFYNYATQCDEEQIDSAGLWIKTSNLLSENRHFKLVQKIEDKDLGLSSTEKMLLLYVFWKTLSGSLRTDLARSVDGIVSRKAERIGFIQSLIRGESPLILRELLEIQKAGFLNESHLKLTDEGIAILEAEGLTIVDKKDSEGFLQPDKIAKKPLYFNPPEEKHIQMLKAALKDENLKEIQSRLKGKNLPVGVTVILHGPPGTGKTESVFQMARKTGRQIFKLEISETKSKWFGDSEKIIKQIFSRYRRSLKGCEKLPILLFNEADAILSKRKDVTSGSVAQTENAMQNILLEELENFEGIFIGTTNLISNLDSAFERRFLFKIAYQKPKPEIKQKIWQDRLPQLSSVECLELSQKFDFSGGQIENICRKILIEEVLHPEAVKFERILEFCKAESFVSSQRNRIGFEPVSRRK